MRGYRATRRLAAVVSVLLVGVVAAQPASAATNPNPVDWSFSLSTDLYHSAYGDVLPLRVGQHDKAGYNDGFGKRHILDGHSVIPDYAHITQALDATCQKRRNADGSTNSVECHDFDTQVVYDPNEPAASRHCNVHCELPVGIITAYYK